MVTLHPHQRLLTFVMLLVAPVSVLRAQESSGSAVGLELPRPDVFEGLENGTAIVPTSDDFEEKERSQGVARPETAPETSHDFAMENPKEQRPIARTEGGSSTWRMKDLLPLLSVLLLIAIVAMLFKRFMPARPLLNGGGALEIVARLSISPKQTLVLVKIGRRLVLLGATAEQINSLAEIDDPDQVAMLLGEVHGSRMEMLAPSFAASFDRESQTYDSEPADLAARDTSGQLQHLLEKLRGMARARDVA